MKKIVSKITSFVLSVALGAVTLASQNTQDFESKAFFQDSEFNYSSLLDTNNMAVYNSLSENFTSPSEETLAITLPEEVIVNLGVRNDHYAPLTSEEDKMVCDAVWSNVMAGCHYFILDYPEAFWQDTQNVSFIYHTNNQGNIYDEKTHETSVVVSSVDIVFPLNSTLNNDFELARQFEAELNKEVANFEVSGNTRFEKVKSIHDNLALRVSYSFDGILAHSAGGSLVGGSSVCEGYAKAFKLICDRENIPCILVLNEAHMWNEVQMEDGNWYIVDVTGDDFDGKLQKIEVDYGCFLKGKSFYESHNRIYEYYGVSFDYPEVADEDYHEASTLKPMRSTDINKNNEVKSENNKIALQTIENLADLNGDGSINVTDIVICHQTILYNTDVECDINNDGITNVFDLITLKKIVKSLQK